VNDSARALRGPLREALQAARVAAGIVATVVLAVLVAACGDSPSSTGSRGSPSRGGSSSARSAEPFSVCMRSHGVPRYPDPNPGSPGFPAVMKSARAVGVSPSRLEAAERGCYHTLPIDATKLNRLSLAQCEYIGDCPRALVQQAMTQLENYARCMRSHGLPQWPDPVIGANGAPYFAISTSKDGFDPYSSQVQAKDRVCTRVEHPAIGGAPVAVSP
jgi:hypothetical protein